MCAAVTGRENRIHTMAVAAVMTALTCVLAPLSVPVGPVPLTFANLIVYLSLYLLGGKLGAVSYMVYVCIGMVGMPVFSGFAGGLGKLLGPTGGYILGWIPATLLAGLAMERCRRRFPQFLALAAGTAVCYALGTVWFCTATDTALRAGFGICVLPFIPGDLAKIAVVLAAGPALREKLGKAGVLAACGPQQKR